MVVNFGLIAEALISGGASLLGSAVSGGFGLISQKKQYKYNQKLMNEQNDLNIANWERQNAYNNPKAQMDRLRAAGINPDLFYSNGASGITASETPTASSGSVGMPTISSDLGSAVSQGLLMDSQVELNKAQASKANAEANNTNANTPWVSKLAESQLKLNDANVKQINEMVEKIRSDTELNRVLTDIRGRENRMAELLFDKQVDSKLAELGASKEQSKVIIETFAKYQNAQIALLVAQSYSNYAQGRAASENAVSSRITANAASRNADTNRYVSRTDYIIKQAQLDVEKSRAKFQNALDKSSIKVNERKIVESQLSNQWREDLNEVPILGRPISDLLGVPASVVGGLLK